MVITMTKRIKILSKQEATPLIKEELLRPVPLFIAKKWRSYTDRFTFVNVIQKGKLVMHYYVRKYNRRRWDA